MAIARGQFDNNSYFLLHRAITKYLRSALHLIITGENGLAIVNLHPVACFDDSGVARPFLLLLHLHVKSFGIDRHIVFTENQLRQIERKTIRVIKLKGNLALQDIYFLQP